MTITLKLIYSTLPETFMFAVARALIWWLLCMAIRNHDGGFAIIRKFRGFSARRNVYKPRNLIGRDKFQNNLF